MKQTALTHLVHTIENEYVGNSWDSLKEAIFMEEKEQLFEMFKEGFEKSTVDFNASNGDLSKEQVEDILKEFFNQYFNKHYTTLSSNSQNQK